MKNRTNSETSLFAAARLAMRACTVVLLSLAVPLSTAWSFDSFPWGAPHDQITRAAADQLGWSERRTGALVGAVRASDWTEVAWSPHLFPPSQWLRMAPNAAYDPAHHFDRAPGETHAQAFERGATFVRAKTASSIAAAKQGDSDKAVSEMGGGIHAVQDLISHSNFIDLPPEDRLLVMEAILGSGDVPAPAALRITGYDPEAADPESPPGDSYSHREFSKDNRRKNPESELPGRGGVPKFELAMSAAIELTVLWMEAVGEQIAAEGAAAPGEIGR